MDLRVWLEFVVVWGLAWGKGCALFVRISHSVSFSSLHFSLSLSLAADFLKAPGVWYTHSIGADLLLSPTNLISLFLPFTNADDFTLFPVPRCLSLFLSLLS